jgi:hypothetical protein
MGEITLHIYAGDHAGNTETYLFICFRIGTGVARGAGGPLCRMGEGAGRGKDLGGALGAGAACAGASYS